MRVWSHRPKLLHAGLFFAAYVLGCGFAQSLAIVPGAGISIWPSGGILMATLVLASSPSWPWWLLVGLGAELFGSVLWFHIPLPAAVLIYAGNALAAAAGAWLVTRTCRRPVRLESLHDVLAFVVLGAGFAPVISATVGSATLAWFGIQSQPFATAWPLWWIRDATGILIVAPLALVLLQNWGSQGQLSAARWMEACILGLIVLGVTALSFGGYLPFAYIIMPPLLWAAVRFEFKGTAATLLVLALITAVFTIPGTSQFAGNPESQKQKHIMLQLFLAVSAVSALIVAAISRQHQLAMPLRDQNGRIVQWYGVCFDGYDEVSAQQALRDRERELSQLVDMVPSHVWRLTPEGEPTFFNKRMVDFVGLDVADMDKPGMSRLVSLIQTVHPDDAAEFRDALGRCLVTGDGFAIRYRLRRSDGVYRWMSSRAEPMRDHAGRIVQWYGLCHDIDDQVHAEEALRRSERELQQLVDALSVHIWSWTPDGRLAYVNKRSLEDLGFSGAHFEDITRVAQQLVHPEDAPGVLRTSARCLKTGDNFVMRYRRRWKEGNYRWIEARCEPLRDRDGTIVRWYQVSIDIDDEMRAEAALRNSKQQLEQMIDALPVNILSFASSGAITYASKRYLETVGSPMAHIQDFDALAQDLAHPEDFQAMHRRASEGFATGRAFVNRFRRRDRDGLYRWIEARAQPLRDADGAIVQWYIISIDLEDEMRAQQALRESERTLRQLVETLPAMLDCAAPDGEPIYRSQQLRDFLGYELEELDGVGKSRLEGTFDGVHPDDVAGVREQYAHSLSTGEPYAHRQRLRRFDGVYRWVETRAAPMRNAEGAIVQWNVICLDIDGEVRAEEELRLAQEKMARASQAASLAELSASIAHEVNQPLAAIVATSHACRRWLSADPPNLERATITLERIIRDANSASEVVSHIRALFSQMGNARSPADLIEVITEVCRLLADDLAANNIRMTTEFDRSLPPALIDRIQIQQVLVNLIRNAIDSLHTAVDGERQIRVRSVRDGAGTIRVEVQDLGAGLQEPERIFEPFFTTKKDGMGMGLAICRSIIEAHDGRLWATGNKPKGTIFAFTLPTQVWDAA